MTWFSAPPRQLTGQPRRFHGYITRHPRVMVDGRLCHAGYHRSPEAARRCAERAAKEQNT